MKIYIDLILIINFFIDLTILIGVSKVLKLYISIKRLLLSSIIGALSTLILFVELNSFYLTVLKVIISIMIVVSCFGIKHLHKTIFYFYIISIILGGSIYLFDITFLKEGNIYSMFIPLIVICPIIIFVYSKELLSYKKNEANIYSVVLIISNKKYQLRGLLDTGNRLHDPYHNRAVILLNNDIKIIKSNYIFIPYKALNHSGVVKCLKPDKVLIDNKEITNCLVGLSNTNFNLGVDCILPNKFTEDL